MNLDWRAIRPLNGSRDEGFEELCAQLASSESPRGAGFTRKGSPDAGVECFSVLENGDEWGWQAKYFHALGDVQWRQLDHSVETALIKHPALVRYYICVPLDRPDARVGGRTSTMERWHQHVAKWQGWASQNEMSVEFKWWGSHELLRMLSAPEQAGRLAFWFDESAFDDRWFHSRLEEALKAAGPRYTPEIHVELPIVTKLELFARTEATFEKIRALSTDVHKSIQSLVLSDSTPDCEALEGELDNLVQAARTALRDLPNLCRSNGVLPVDRILGNISRAEQKAFDIANEFHRRSLQYSAEGRASERDTGHHDNPFRERHNQVARLERSLDDCYRELSEFGTLSNARLMILTGDGGIGKTHLLCDFAKSRIESDAPIVLLMGQEFLTLESPWTQVLKHLSLNDIDRDQFIGSLETAAQTANSRALIVIDALNEGRGRELWKTSLASFLAPLEKSPWISVAVSVRSPYEDYVIPEFIKKEAAVIRHEGFTDVGYEATRAFFDHYGIEFPSAPMLQPEFNNPLFLKTLCYGLQRLGQTTLPRGSRGVTWIFDIYLRALNVTLAERLDYDPSDFLVREALEGVAHRLANEGMEKGWLSKREMRKIVNALLPGRDFSRSLYRALVDEGVLLESISGDIASPDEFVQISYQRFADHIIVETLLSEKLDSHFPEKAFADQGALAFLADESMYVPHGILEALCVQMPEYTGKELLDIAPAMKLLPSVGTALSQQYRLAKN